MRGDVRIWGEMLSAFGNRPDAGIRSLGIPKGHPGERAILGRTEWDRAKRGQISDEYRVNHVREKKLRENGNARGDVVGALTVRISDELMLITQAQMVPYQGQRGRETGRNTMA